MAIYTIELKELLDNSNVDINSYMQNYPLYTFKKLFQNDSDFGKNYKGEQITNFRDYLNNKIYEHYYFQEIGCETAHRFGFYLERRMKEIMPFFNQHFESIDIEFNPLWNVDLTETYTHNVEDTGNSTMNAIGKTIENGSSKREENLEQNVDSNTTNNSTRTPTLTNENVGVEMDTAEQDLTFEDIKTHGFASRAKHDVNTTTGTETENVNSANLGKVTNENVVDNTNENEINNTNDSTAVNSNNRTETYVRKQEGSSAGYLFTQNIKEWRKIMVNIPMEIVEKLSDLFIGIY